MFKMQCLRSHCFRYCDYPESIEQIKSMYGGSAAEEDRNASCVRRLRQHLTSSRSELRRKRHTVVLSLLLVERASELMKAAHESRSDVAGETNARWKDPSCDAPRSRIIASGS